MTRNSPRILITRLSHIGDCVLTLPMLYAIKKKYPDCLVVWVVESPTQKLLAAVPEIDELIVIPKSWMSKWSNWRELRNRLRQFRFDIVIDPQGITKSAMLGKLSGAKTRIGIKGKWGRELSPWLNNVLVETKHHHLVDRSLELLVTLGIEDSGARIELPVSSSSRQSIQRSLDGMGVRQFVAINPGASWPSKRWETSRFGEIARYLHGTHAMQTVISWAGDEELEMAMRIQRLAAGSAVVAPRTSLTELAAMYAMARFFIGCDTGPMHIAAAVQTPCIGLYGPTRPTDSGAYGANHIHIQNWYQSGTCRQRRAADNLAMNDISVADVCCAIDQMMVHLRNHAGDSSAA